MNLQFDRYLQLALKLRFYFSCLIRSIKSDEITILRLTSRAEGFRKCTKPRRENTLSAHLRPVSIVHHVAFRTSRLSLFKSSEEKRSLGTMCATKPSDTRSPRTLELIIRSHDGSFPALRVLAQCGHRALLRRRCSVPCRRGGRDARHARRLIKGALELSWLSLAVHVSKDDPLTTRRPSLMRRAICNVCPSAATGNPLFGV